MGYCSHEHIFGHFDGAFSSMLVLCSLLLCIFFLICQRKLGASLALMPPSPPSLPIIVHLYLLRDHIPPHQSLHELSKLYGPLFSLRLGCIPAIVASSPNMAREILHTHDLNFASRPRITLAKYAIFDSPDIAFSSYGPYWRLMRRICATDLFAHKRFQSFRAMRAQEVLLFLQSVLRDSIQQKEVPIRSRLLFAINNIISRMTFGKKFSDLAAGCTSCEASSTDILSDLLTEFVFLLGVFNIGDFIPGLQWMDLQGYVRRSKAVGSKLKAMFQEIVDARREQRRRTGSSNTPRDLLDALLRASEDNKQDIIVNDDDIKAVLVVHGEQLVI